jgi:xanthine/uracil permease
MALLPFSLVSISGLRLIVNGRLSHRDDLIVAMALGVSFGAPSQAEWGGEDARVFPGIA